MAAQASVRVTQPQDLEWVLPWCSADELRTIREMYDDEPEALLRLAIYSDRPPWTGLINGDPVCIFGAYVPSLLSDEIYVWLLGTRKLRQYPMLFMRYCSPVLDWMTKGYSVVKATMDDRNVQARRLARSLGFEVMKNKSWQTEIQMRKH